MAYANMACKFEEKKENFIQTHQNNYIRKESRKNQLKILFKTKRERFLQQNIQFSNVHNQIEEPQNFCLVNTNLYLTQQPNLQVEFYTPQQTTQQTNQENFNMAKHYFAFKQQKEIEQEKEIYQKYKQYFHSYNDILPQQTVSQLPVQQNLLSQKQNYNFEQKSSQLELKQSQVVNNPFLPINQYTNKEYASPNNKQKINQKIYSPFPQSNSPTKMPFVPEYESPDKYQKIKGKDLQKIGNFYIDYSRVLGEGSFSKVYKGRHISNSDFVVAIKEIDLRKCDCKFSEEIRITKSVSHQNVIKIYESIIFYPKCFIVLEYCPKGNLAQVVNQIPKEQAIEYFRQIVYGMSALYNSKIIHRDLKLENLLISEKNIIKICDFGFAKELSSNLEVRSIKCGTPSTMAPEIFHADSFQPIYNSKCDVFSMGVILHQMFYKSHPYDFNKEKFRMNQRVQVHNPHPIIEDFLNKALTYNPKQRLDWNQVFEHPIMNLQLSQQNQFRIFEEKQYIPINFQNIKQVNESPKKIAQLTDISQENQLQTTKKLIQKGNKKSFQIPSIFSPQYKFEQQENQKQKQQKIISEPSEISTILRKSIISLLVCSFVYVIINKCFGGLVKFASSHYT